LAENKSKKKPTEKKQIELSAESAEKIVTDIKNRGVYTEAKPKRKYNKTKKTSL
jgi:hypothetical protein